MKMMRRSDVICLVSGLLSRLKQNERCPRSHLHFLSSHTVETNNIPTCPTFGVVLFVIFHGSGTVWIYRAVTPRQQTVGRPHCTASV